MISKSLKDINIIIICNVINIIMATKCVVNAPSPICFLRFHWLGPGGEEGRCLQGNMWHSPPASMTSRLATVTF